MKLCLGICKVVTVLYLIYAFIEIVDILYIKIAKKEKVIYKLKDLNPAIVFNEKGTIKNIFLSIISIFILFLGIINIFFI